MGRITRRQLLGTGGGAAVVGALLGPGIANAQADKPIASPWSMVVDVALDPPAAGASPMGPFYHTGRVFRGGALAGGAPAGGAVPIGSVRAWGWTWDGSQLLGGSAGTVAFDIAGQGEIVITGVLDNRASVVGGTGNYRGINGQADVGLLSPTSLRVVFDITSYRNGPTA